MSVNRWLYQIELFHLSAASFSSVEEKAEKTRYFTFYTVELLVIKGSNTIPP